MTIADLTTKIKVILDEYSPDDISEPFTDYVVPMLSEAAREVLDKAPLHLLTPTAIPLATTGPPPVSTVIYYNHKAYIPVPDDYIKLYEIKYPLWKKSIYKAFPVESPSYKVQANESLAPGYGRPFVGIIQTAPGTGSLGRYFECGRVEDPGTGTLTPIATYVKSTTADQIRDVLTDALCWLTASKLFAIFRMGDLAKFAQDQFTQQLIYLGNS